MSRSYKKAILKDKPKNHSRTAMYWRKIRRVIKNKIRSYPWGLINQTMDDERYEYSPDWGMSLIKDMPKDIPDLEDTLPDPKSIVNDYDYCDFIIDFEKKQPWNKSIFDEAEFMKYWNESRAKHRRK